MDLETLLARYDGRVPRYTSYPTAPHFSPAVDETLYRSWLGELGEATPVSLYLHVPFCAELCLFCGCHTRVVRRSETLEAYGRHLLTEIDLLAEAACQPLLVRQVHWGGGTPTMLPPEWMLLIMQRLRDRFSFAADSEIAVEIDPRTVSPESLDALQEIGTTRASVGVQDFDPQVQRAIGRMQSFEITADCVERLRRLGIGSLNFDLLYGLPYQTVASVETTLAQALSLRPDRVAVFGYAHVPWMKKHQALLPETALPNTLQRFHQYRAASSVLEQAGYDPIGLDHFARPDDALAQAARNGWLRRNFQGYTTDQAPVLLGLGASAIGALPHGYVQNITDVRAWQGAVSDGHLPIARGVALTDDDRLRRAIIEQIMCDLQVDLADTAARHGRDVVELMTTAPALQSMARDGLIEWGGYWLRVTDTGRPFVRSVAAVFDAYLPQNAARHSVAV